jgi:hypothetical protein
MILFRLLAKHIQDIFDIIICQNCLQKPANWKALSNLFNVRGVI